jgi:PST family polysaccharide transporter
LKNPFILFINKKNSTVANNFIALSLLQITNYIFPLITIPYITRIFGVELYGLIVFATSFITYFTLIVSYGFDLSGSREITQNRNDWVIVEEIFNRIIFTKLFLFIASSIVFVIALFTIAKVNQVKVLYIIMFSSVLFNVFFPTWFFQGIEKLNYTAIFTFVVKLIFTVIIFILIKSKSDYLLYPLATLVGQIIVAGISLSLIVKKYKIKIKFPMINKIWKTLKEGFKIFYTTVVINLYTTTNIVLLGFLASDYDVGIYSAAHKILMIVLTIIAFPLNQSLFPSIGYAFSQSYDMGVKRIYDSLIIVFLLILLPCIFLFTFSEQIIIIIFGTTFSPAIETLRIFSFVPMAIGVSNVFALQGLLNLRKDNQVSIVVTIGALLGILLNLHLVPIYKYNGAAISLLITESMISIMMVTVFIRNTNYKQDIKNYVRALNNKY